MNEHIPGIYVDPLRRLRLLPVAVALSLLTAPIALGAPQVHVTGGTLSIDGTDAAAVSTSIANSSLVGPRAGEGTLVGSFAYGPRFVWRGAAPGPGAGCRDEPADSVSREPARVFCPDVARIDIALGHGDDYVGITGWNIPVKVDGGPGADGLAYDGSVERDPVLAGGPGDDSLGMDIDSPGAGTVRGGPGDDYIKVEGPITVDCGPGDDDVVDDHWYLHRKNPAIVDAATCGPVLRPVLEAPSAHPPAGPDELSFPGFAKPHNGRVSLLAFRPSESGRGTMQLRRARSVNRLGFPLAGTRWAACSERRHFRMRAGRVVRPTLPLLARVRRRVAALKMPKSRFYKRGAMLPCSLHIRGVDDDGERFRRNDLSILLVNGD